MSAVEEILSRIPMGQLAARLGVDEGTAEQAARQAVPALLGGIRANTDDPGGASSFARAVEKHDGGLVDGGVDLGQVDEADGDKIVGHVFGPQRDQVVQALGGAGGAGGGQDLIAKLLPILAPIVMSWLAQKFGGRAAEAGGGGGMGDLLGGVLGSVLGGAGGPAGQGGGAGAGGGLGDLLGGLLGAGRRQ
jgi:hypothetical protein